MWNINCDQGPGGRLIELFLKRLFCFEYCRYCFFVTGDRKSVGSGRTLEATGEQHAPIVPMYSR